MATTYIIGRVVNGDYGVAIAYSAVLILLMVAAIVAIQWLVGVRVVAARAAEGAPVSAAPAAGTIELRARDQALWRRRRGRRRLAHRRGRHARHPPRALGVRQDDDPAADRRAGDAERRPGADRRPRRHHLGAGGAQRQPGLPVLRALPAPHGARQRRLRAAGARRPRGGGARAGARGAGPRRADRARGAPARPALGRPAAARGPGPRPRARSRPRSCSTSRCPTSTRGCAGGCATRSARSSAGSASPSCT